MIHTLKCWNPYYTEIVAGRKRFEIRINDRDYRENDILRLQEYDPNQDEYSGREIKVRVIYVLSGGPFGLFGLQPGYVAMSIIKED